MGREIVRASGKNSSWWEHKTVSSLPVWSSRLWRCVALGAKGHLRWQKNKRNRQREWEWIIITAEVQNNCHGLASISKGLWLWKRRNAYISLSCWPSRKIQKMAMRCFPFPLVQPGGLSGCKSVWLLSAQLLPFYPDHREKEKNKTPHFILSTDWQ